MLRRILVPAILLTFGVLVCIAMLSLIQKKAKKVSWGKGKIKASERGYYTSRAQKIGKNWRQNFRDNDLEPDGRPKEPYDTFLVIDTSKPAMWLESKGKIIKHNYDHL